MFGKHCQEVCGKCLNDGQCHHINGSCLYGCNPGYYGIDCREGTHTWSQQVYLAFTCLPPLPQSHYMERETNHFKTLYNSKLDCLIVLPTSYTDSLPWESSVISFYSDDGFACYYSWYET